VLSGDDSVKRLVKLARHVEEEAIDRDKVARLMIEVWLMTDDATQNCEAERFGSTRERYQCFVEECRVGRSGLLATGY
jgi:hypothetical protein